MNATTFHGDDEAIITNAVATVGLDSNIRERENRCVVGGCARDKRDSLVSEQINCETKKVGAIFCHVSEI